MDQKYGRNRTDGNLLAFIISDERSEVVELSLEVGSQTTRREETADCR